MFLDTKHDTITIKINRKTSKTFANIETGINLKYKVGLVITGEYDQVNLSKWCQKHLK